MGNNSPGCPKGWVNRKSWAKYALNERQWKNVFKNVKLNFVPCPKIPPFLISVNYADDMVPIGTTGHNTYMPTNETSPILSVARARWPKMATFTEKMAKKIK